MAIVFPLLLLHEASHDWNLVGTTTAAGQTVSASNDVRSDGGGFWSASLNDIQLWYREYALLWRAVRQVANGGVTKLEVSRGDGLQPWPNGITSYGVIDFSDGSLFSDGSGYTQPVIDVAVGAPANLRDISIELEVTNSGDLLGGEAFAIEHPTYGWRMYEIATVTDISDGVVSITFNPPLREALSGGEQVEFDRPRCLMKLVNASAMDLNLVVLPNSVATVKFVEAKFGS